MRCRKIVILGPESTGKSTLCEGLAAHFLPFGPSDWVPEYAREFLEMHGMDYKYEDLVTIARGQLRLEDEAVLRYCTPGRPGFSAGSGISAAAGMQAAEPVAFSGNLSATPTSDASVPEPLLFIDTDMYVMKVWSEFVFGRCETWILDQIVERGYDGYLLCSPDLPWTYDKLREYPDEGPRETLFHIYKDLMINQSTPWAIVSGQHEDRLRSAIASVERFLLH